MSRRITASLASRKLLGILARISDSAASAFDVSKFLVADCNKFVVDKK